jgi:hypothetical protein
VPQKVKRLQEEKSPHGFREGFLFVAGEHKQRIMFFSEENNEL